VCGQENLIDHVFIHEKLGISNEGAVDIANATYDKEKTTLKKIASLHAFVENEQWNEVRMKDVATLALGSRPRPRLARVQAKREARESHLMLPGVQKSVRE
jgi:hypothetical protein